MTNKDMKEWMREKGYFNIWVLPMKGYNAGIPYEDHPVGDSLKMMPLDSSLFEDLHAGVAPVWFISQMKNPMANCT